MGRPAGRKSVDGVRILHDRIVGKSKRKERLLAEEGERCDIAQQVYDLRHQANLTQEQLAKLIGTKASAISRLEDAEYQGHSLRMLARIAAALGQRVEVRFVPDSRVAL